MLISAGDKSGLSAFKDIIFSFFIFFNAPIFTTEHILIIMSAGKSWQGEARAEGEVASQLIFEER